MSTEVSGMIECRPWRTLWDDDDQEAGWQGAVDLFLLNTGNAYSALACLFGVRNSYGFRPLSEGRGLPTDMSDAARSDFAAYPDAHGTTWITWAEIAAADWDETNESGSLRRRDAVDDDSGWGPVWNVMETLAALHGDDNVRLVVWFT
ncbi:hypothetical protein ACFCV9_18460 [Streptomyces sp. NPDC056367]|uniref:hypothetical protein n=1 Tax=Streptomyces sp. NPDC056367 TaxID=3345797 RepID=UPI0035D794E7